ncbi:hypothetical protein QCA50_018403 [Cerrena zonata]|uniref:Reverse transcriptase RNase H-like domain-containing protein n=1 Tax=Cerrena zonata TaxID=2478898 RepID=A0AAW0FDD3_9APHY
MPLDYSSGAKPIWLVMDGSIAGIAGVVQGCNFWMGHVAAFYSAKLTSAQSNYPVHEIKMLAVRAPSEYTEHDNSNCLATHLASAAISMPVYVGIEASAMCLRSRLLPIQVTTEDKWVSREEKNGHVTVSHEMSLPTADRHNCPVASMAQNNRWDIPQPPVITCSSVGVNGKKDKGKAQRSHPPSITPLAHPAPTSSQAVNEQSGYSLCQLVRPTADVFPAVGMEQLTLADT